jgi:hypothetical protein
MTLVVTLWMLVVVIAAVVVGILRRVIPLLERVGDSSSLPSRLAPLGLPVGSRLPAFHARTLDDERFTADDLLGSNAIVLFLDSNCPACRMLEVDMHRSGMAELSTRLFIVVRDASEALRLTGLEATILLQRDNAVTRAFASNATPHAFAISAEGLVVATETPNTVAGLQRLAGQIEEGGEQGTQLTGHLTVAK